MNTLFRSARLRDAEALTMMSMELYNEVINRKDFSQNKVVATLQFYEQHTDMGSVLMIECDGELAGYAITFRFWSNEYGGLMLGIDEMYIRKSYRRLGIARAFINALINEGHRNHEFVGIEMESHTANDNFNQFITAIGIPRNENCFYVELFDKDY